jgi:hypothetical protein
MKNIILLATLLISINSVWSQDIPAGESGEVVLETISDSSHETTLTVREDSFIPNIMGYACPVPAINFDKYLIWDRALNHNQFADFGVRIFALKIKDPNMQFCHYPTALEVFGEDFIVGAEFKLTIRTVRQIIKVIRRDGSERKILRETISSELGGIALFSKAQLELSAR